MKQILDYGLELENVKEYKINLSQKQSVELLKDTLNKFEIRGEKLYLLKNAIENVLAERKQDKAKIKELETKQRAMCEEYCPKTERIGELEKELKRKKVFIFMASEVIKYSISFQKIENKIEEFKKEYEIALEENSTKAFILKCKISVLEELLEEK